MLLAPSALLVAACAGPVATVESCPKEIVPEAGSYVVGSDPWIADTTDAATGERLAISPVDVEKGVGPEQGPFSIIGDRLSRQIDSLNSWVRARCPTTAAQVPPPERADGPA